MIPTDHWANRFSGVIINLCTCPPDTQGISHTASLCFFVLRKFAGSFKHTFFPVPRKKVEHAFTTLHVMRKFNWSFNLTCIFAVVSGALQNYVNVHSTVIWKRMCLSPPDSRPEHALIYCPGPTFLYKVWGELVLFAKGGSWSSGVVVSPGRHFLVVSGFNRQTWKNFSYTTWVKKLRGTWVFCPYLLLSIAT
jgi:hypothetical protein